MTRIRLVQRCLFLFVSVTVVLTGCGRRSGTLEGTVAGVSESGALFQVAVYDLDKPEGAANLDVFTRGSIVIKEVLGKDGIFSFSLPPGSYIVEAWVDGLETDSRMVQVRSGRVTKVELDGHIPSP